MNVRPEDSHTYMVQNRSSPGELKRLQIQDQMITSGMGGALPEQADLTGIRQVLDVGCGTGSWLIEAAKTYPAFSLLVGMDISSKMIIFAQVQANSQQMRKRVEFRVMDALQGLDLPDAHFDLVNLRMGDSWLRTWEWSALQCLEQRVVRPGGLIRITESDMVSDTSRSQAGTRFMDLVFEALYQAEHYFIHDRSCLLPDLVPMLQRWGLQNVRTQAYRLAFHAGMPELQSLSEDAIHAFQNFLPFLRKWTRLPEDYETLEQQMLQDMQPPEYCATWNFLTIWGTRPAEESLFIRP
jgi:ubiquinone/menaquinone biosynthesis C-methylase UbiE